jgi:hypothetical protein
LEELLRVRNKKYWRLVYEKKFSSLIFDTVFRFSFGASATASGRAGKWSTVKDLSR